MRVHIWNLTAGACPGISSWANCGAMIVRGQFWCEKVKRSQGNGMTYCMLSSPEKRETVGKCKEKGDRVQKGAKKKLWQSH